MSKSILTIGLLVVAIAAPYLAPVALGLAAGSLAGLAVVAAIEVGVALAGSLLVGGAPKGNLTQTALSRLYATLVTTEPRKTAFGQGASGNDVRYHQL